MAPASELGVLLRHWRDRRGRSQLDLSMDTGVSQRHISFIESGRSVPSRHKLLDIAEALDVLPPGHAFTVPEVLFRKITDEERAEWQVRFAGVRT